MKINLIEMEGLLRGQCIPGDLIVNETLAEYLVRQFGKLEQQLAAVVAENADLKQAITTHSESTHFCEVCGKDDPCSTYDVCYVLNETPATDAAIAKIQAQGVEMYAVTLDRGADDAERDGFEDGMKFLRAEAEAVRKFAAQLRQGEKS